MCLPTTYLPRYSGLPSSVPGGTIPSSLDWKGATAQGLPSLAHPPSTIALTVSCTDSSTN
eukprot:scaffold126667_cov26-Cyclotella_meneghiniana.AAC.1